MNRDTEKVKTDGLGPALPNTGVGHVVGAPLGYAGVYVHGHNVDVPPRAPHPSLSEHLTYAPPGSQHVPPPPVHVNGVVPPVSQLVPPQSGVVPPWVVHAPLSRHSRRQDVGRYGGLNSLYAPPPPSPCAGVVQGGIPPPHGRPAEGVSMLGYMHSLPHGPQVPVPVSHGPPVPVSHGPQVPVSRGPPGPVVASDPYVSVPHAAIPQSATPLPPYPSLVHMAHSSGYQPPAAAHSSHMYPRHHPFQFQPQGGVAKEVLSLPGSIYSGDDKGGEGARRTGLTEEEKKERNRLHAKKTRLRKKEAVKGLVEDIRFQEEMRSELKNKILMRVQNAYAAYALMSFQSDGKAMPLKQERDFIGFGLDVEWLKVDRSRYFTAEEIEKLKGLETDDLSSWVNDSSPEQYEEEFDQKSRSYSYQQAVQPRSECTQADLENRRKERNKWHARKTRERKKATEKSALKQKSVLEKHVALLKRYNDFQANNLDKFLLRANGGLGSGVSQPPLIKREHRDVFDDAKSSGSCVSPAKNISKVCNDCSSNSVVRGKGSDSMNEDRGPKKSEQNCGSGSDHGSTSSNISDSKNNDSRGFSEDPTTSLECTKSSCDGSSGNDLSNKSSGGSSGSDFSNKSSGSEGDRDSSRSDSRSENSNEEDENNISTCSDEGVESSSNSHREREPGKKHSHSISHSHKLKKQKRVQSRSPELSSKGRSGSASDLGSDSGGSSPESNNTRTAPKRKHKKEKLNHSGGSDQMGPSGDSHIGSSTGPSKSGHWNNSSSSSCQSTSNTTNAGDSSPKENGSSSSSPSKDSKYNLISQEHSKGEGEDGQSHRQDQRIHINMEGVEVNRRWS